MTVSEDFTSVTGRFRGALAELLREDVALEMPPELTWFRGRQPVTCFIASYLLTAPGGLRLVPVVANGQPAFAVYRRERDDGAYDVLAPRGVRVHAVLTGPTDTDMTWGFDIPKASPESVARAIFDALEHGEEDIFPDPMSASVADGWRRGVAKAMERENAAFVPAEPAAA